MKSLVLIAVEEQYQKLTKQGKLETYAKTGKSHYAELKVNHKQHEVAQKDLGVGQQGELMCVR